MGFLTELLLVLIICNVIIDPQRNIVAGRRHSLESATMDEDRGSVKPTAIDISDNPYTFESER